jgi:hypothetical protein
LPVKSARKRRPEAVRLDDLAYPHALEPASRLEE